MRDERGLEYKSEFRQKTFRTLLGLAYSLLIQVRIRCTNGSRRRQDTGVAGYWRRGTGREGPQTLLISWGSPDSKS